MKKLIALIGFSLFSTLISAQQAFDGFNIQIGIGGAQSQINTTGTEDTSLIPTSSFNGTSTATRLNGVASFGYSKSFDSLFKGFNLAANVFYIIGNQSAGATSNTVYDADLNVTQTLSGSYKLKNTWGISLEPGYYFSKDLLGYLKFAYVSSSASVYSTCYTSDSHCYGTSGSFDSMSSSTTFNKTINGVGYGFGGKYQITKSVYAGLDFLYVDYSKVSQSFTWTGYSMSDAQFKPKQYMGFISVGYKF